MNLREAYSELDIAAKNFIKVAMSDDKTPLGNALALAQEARLVGTGDGNPDVVIFGDLNRFKGLNDQLGHSAGDLAIRAIGQLINSFVVRKCKAKAFRRRGDEFIILLSSEKLQTFLVQLVEFAACSFWFQGNVYKTAMSFGYALCDGKADFTDLIGRAETACQIAKAQGDGTCIEWSQEIERKAIINFRDRCMPCGAQITVNVPRETAPTQNCLLSCPCCGRQLKSGS